MYFCTQCAVSRSRFPANRIYSTSDEHAERNRQNLDELIGERLKDSDMERRLRLVEEHFRLRMGAQVQHSSTAHSSTSDELDDVTIRGDTTQVNTQIPIAPAAPRGGILSPMIFQRKFERVLNKTWVYRRNQDRDEDISFHSSEIRLSAWSVLSELSLADISIIAVLALPVCFQELANDQWYRVGMQQAEATAESNDLDNADNHGMYCPGCGEVSPLAAFFAKIMLTHVE